MPRVAFNDAPDVIALHSSIRSAAGGPAEDSGNYNGVRLHAGLQYVTPNDEHEGRGDAIHA